MRQRLDRRWLEEAFLLSASLEMIEHYNLWDKLSSLPCERNDMVNLVAEPFCDAFINKWDGKFLRHFFFKPKMENCDDQYGFLLIAN